MSLTKEEFGLLRLQRESTKILLGFGSVHGMSSLFPRQLSFKEIP